MSMLSFAAELRELPHFRLFSSLLLVSAASIYYWTLRQKYLPPGPRGLPILGNIHQIGRQPWITFTKWRHQYGPLLYLNIAGTPTLVLSSQKVATDLLDRRSAIYSDRPRNIVTNILSGGNLFALTQPNMLWKRMRRASHEMLGPNTVQDYHGSQERDAILLVSQMLHDPPYFHDQICRANGSLSMSVIYGTPPVLDVSKGDIRQTNDFTERILSSAAPGAFLVHHFTWLEHLPRFMAPWRSYAEAWFEKDSHMFERLFANVEERLSQGDDTPCILSTVIKNQTKSGLGRSESSWLAATLFAAAAEAMSSQMEWFLVSMILYPDVQRRAQVQIDEVVGRDRMPTLADCDELPYLKALVKEVFRWRTTVPLGIPHQLAEDDWYDGYFLPKGSLILPNIWKAPSPDLHKDTAVYGDDVEAFRPERHLTPEGELKPAPADTKDEGHFSYGFGRRICVGRHLSNRTLLIETATILWSFTVSPGKDAGGNESLPDPDAGRVDGLVVRPSPFPYMLAPRFPEVPGLVAQSMDLCGLNSPSKE